MVFCLGLAIGIWIGYHMGYEQHKIDTASDVEGKISDGNP